MAVAVDMRFVGATLEQYDQVIEKMGFEPTGKGAPGALFHTVMKTDDGIRVIDVWKTKELFEKFAEEQIGPITSAVGVPNPPQINFLTLHNYLTAGELYSR